jgi:type IV secretory pathway VirB10-like protein
MKTDTTRAALAGAVSIPLLLGAVSAPAYAVDETTTPAETVSSEQVAPAPTADPASTADPVPATPAPAADEPQPVAVAPQAPTAPATPRASKTRTAKAASAESASTKARGKTIRKARTLAPSRHRSPHKFATVSYNKWYAKNYMQYKYKWGKGQRKSLIKLWQHESGWNQHAHNGSSGAHGIPQALPGNKMGSHGKNWAGNPETQIKWGLSYIKSRYGSPNKAWRAWQHKGWY